MAEHCGQIAKGLLKIAEAPDRRRKIEEGYDPLQARCLLHSPQRPID